MSLEIEDEEMVDAMQLQPAPLPARFVPTQVARLQGPPHSHRVPPPSVLTLPASPQPALSSASAMENRRLQRELDAMQAKLDLAARQQEATEQSHLNQIMEERRQAEAKLQAQLKVQQARAQADRAAAAEEAKQQAEGQARAWGQRQQEAAQQLYQEEQRKWEAKVKQQQWLREEAEKNSHATVKQAEAAIATTERQAAAQRAELAARLQATETARQQLEDE
jgi:hypothetical protein